MVITIAVEKLYFFDKQGGKQPCIGRLQVSIGSGQGIKFSADKVIKAMINLPKVGEK